MHFLPSLGKLRNYKQMINMSVIFSYYIIQGTVLSIHNGTCNLFVHAIVGEP